MHTSPTLTVLYTLRSSHIHIESVSHSHTHTILMHTQTLTQFEEKPFTHNTDRLRDLYR